MLILLIEDTRAIAAVMSARLASFGHEVIIAHNGQDGVEKFADSSPDLILMDIDMPVMNGFEATSRIRAIEATRQWAWTPILFLTASDTAENLVTAIEAGGDDFLSKSVPEVVLHAKMQAMARIATMRQQLSIANQKLAEQANRDGLTGLCNRRHMDARLNAAWADAVRSGEPFGLLMLDVDNFKKYNDHYSHLLGDDCLRTVAQAIASVVETANADHRTKDAFSARYGGEEFAVIMPRVPVSVYREIAAEILEAIRNNAIPHEKNGAWGIVTASIGGAYASASKGEVVELFRTADSRLYKAKANGRNRAELSG